MSCLVVSYDHILYSIHDVVILLLFLSLSLSLLQHNNRDVLVLLGQLNNVWCNIFFKFITPSSPFLPLFS